MSLTAATNSNNQAEYLGLAIGLAAADRHQWRPFEVVGDSTLIIRQLQHYRPPKPDRLLPLYRVARHLVDKLGVERWHHYLRAYNKMADTAANVAMDGRHSIHSFAPVLPPGMGQD
jgi:ribonuclease HI